MSVQHSVSICSSCKSTMELQEKIEGGGDIVERYRCPNCERESYLGKFTNRLEERKTDDASGRVGPFFCRQCGIRTAGIVLSVKSRCRWCPLCRKPLFQYDGCSRETLENSGSLCATCIALNIAEEARPSIDTGLKGASRNGGWTA